MKAFRGLSFRPKRKTPIEKIFLNNYINTPINKNGSTTTL